MKAFSLVTVPPTVVTETCASPSDPAGVTAVIFVADTTTTFVAATAPIFTLVAPKKFVPVIEMAVAPKVEPVVGVMAEMVGDGVTYVNALVLIAVPPGVVTATLCAPAIPAGVFAVICVGDTITTLVAAAPPTVTLVAPVKFVPVIVMAVAPVVGPVIGLTDAMVGAGPAAMTVANVHAT